MRIAGGSARSIPPHVAFQFVGRRGLRSSHDVQRHGLVRVAAEAADFEVLVGLSMPDDCADRRKGEAARDWETGTSAYKR